MVTTGLKGSANTGSNPVLTTKKNKIMAYKLNAEDENPLWRNYMNNVNMDDEEWLKKINLKTPFPSKNTSVYSEEEFLDKLKTDKEFFERWGEIV